MCSGINSGQNVVGCCWLNGRLRGRWQLAADDLGDVQLVALLKHGPHVFWNRSTGSRGAGRKAGA